MLKINNTLASEKNISVKYAIAHMKLYLYFNLSVMYDFL